MLRKPHWFLILGGLLFIMAALVFATGTPTLAQDPGDGTPDPIGEPPQFLTGFWEAWSNSPHADVEAEAFNHWNEDEEGVVPDRCARCHSTPGYRDYLGADGSEFGVVDAPAPLGTVINCDACHNQVASNLTEVSFPSGAVIDNINSDSTRCMVCHQGRAWGGQVDESVAELGLEDPNAVSEELRFINIHYYAAAASLFGSEVHAGYEFEGHTYQLRGDHVEAYDTCAECHSPHTLEVKVNECAACHEGVETVEDLYNVRMNGSLTDYDGDGDIEEGIYNEITTLQETLYAAMQAYANEITGVPILYDAHRYPYFFADADGNGEVNGEEGGYNAFTSLLLKAAYNYQVSQKDPGAFAHNPKYHIELLYDSIMMLNEQLSEPVAMGGDPMTQRNDPGHFDSTGEPFRHWDEDGEVPGTCARCHTAEGMPFLAETGVSIPREPSNSLECVTCHVELGGEWTRITIDEVPAPSGAILSFGEGVDSNICLYCHQGRESTVSVNDTIARAGVGDDEVSDALGFRNIHYFAAGATLFGAQGQGIYQYDGKEYSGQLIHTRSYDECVDCHDVHELEVRAEECLDCHEDIESPEDIEMIRLDEFDDPVDYDGDGDVTEPIKAEIQSYQDALYAAIQDYAANVIGVAIVYDGHSYPYFFTDADGDGVGDERYASWTPTLVRAAYNYQYSLKDPGAWAHNPDYILQALYDSIEAIGGEEAVASFTRAPVLD